MQIYENLSLDSLPGEEWKPFPNSTRYNISNLGRVKYSYIGKVRIVFVSINDRGYRRICFHLNAEEKVTIKICRIVGLVFVSGKTEFRKEINHKDGNKLNDAASNLEWCSRSENIQHAFDIGLCVAATGLDHGNSRICLHLEYGCFCTIKEAAIMSNKLPSNMWKELHGKRKNSTKFILV